MGCDSHRARAEAAVATWARRCGEALGKFAAADRRVAPDSHRFLVPIDPRLAQASAPRSGASAS